MVRVRVKVRPQLSEVGDVCTGDELGVARSEREEVVQDDGNDKIEEDETGDDLRGKALDRSRQTGWERTDVIE